jgi:hypothetical protein
MMLLNVSADGQAKLGYMESEPTRPLMSRLLSTCDEHPAVAVRRHALRPVQGSSWAQATVAVVHGDRSVSGTRDSDDCAVSEDLHMKQQKNIKVGHVFTLLGDSRSITCRTALA